VTKVGDAALASPLVPGMEIVGGPRRDDATTWTFFLPDGRRVELDHAAQTPSRVRLVEVGRVKGDSESLGERGCKSPEWDVAPCLLQLMNAVRCIGAKPFTSLANSATE
jgi:hypothetical protein